MSNQTSDNNKRIAKNTLLPYVLYDGGGCCMRAVSYREYFRIKDRHNERRTIQQLQKAYTKEAFANIIQADLRQKLLSYVQVYCKQFYNFKNVADFFEFAARMIRR